MESQAHAQPRLAGQRSPSSVSLATSSRKSITRPCTWSRSEPAGTNVPHSWSSKSPTHTASPWTRTWCTLRSRPITVSLTQWRAVWALRAGSAIKPHSRPTAVTWCAADEATTRTNTRVCGNVTASSCGAVMSNATRAVRGQRYTHANKKITCSSVWNRGAVN